MSERLSDEQLEDLYERAPVYLPCVSEFRQILAECLARGRELAELTTEYEAAIASTNTMGRERDEALSKLEGTEYQDNVVDRIMGLVKAAGNTDAWNECPSEMVVTLIDQRDAAIARAEEAEAALKRYEAEPYSKLLGEVSILRHQLKRLTECRGYEDFKQHPDTECRYCQNRAELEGRP